MAGNLHEYSYEYPPSVHVITSQNYMISKILEHRHSIANTVWHESFLQLNLTMMLKFDYYTLAQNQQQTDVCIAHSGELQSMDDTILGMLSFKFFY